MWDKIWDFLSDPKILQGTILGALLVKLVEYLSRKILIFLHTRQKALIDFSVMNVDIGLAKSVRFGYLLVRFGRDEFIREVATDKEKREAFLQNKEIYAKNNYSEDNKKLDIKISVKIHKKLGTQFKCFIDVLESDKMNEVLALLQKDDKFYDVKVSGSGKNRIYFLLKLKNTSDTKTPEGIVNNYIYPV